jgi:creatinine amidohydrolase
MTSPEIRDSVKTIKIVIVPVGSIEQHGPHLPIDTDLSTVEYLAEQSVLKARQDSGRPIAVIAPSLPYGVTLEMDWPGHVFLQPLTHIQLLCDVGGQLLKSGFRYIVFLNGCVGNIGTLNVAISQMKATWREKGHFIGIGSTWAYPDAIVRNSGPGGMGHACEIETSTELVIDPKHVHMEKAVNEHIRHPSPLITYDFDTVQPFYWPEHFAEMTQSGVIGDPKAATAENGQKILDANVERIAELLIHFDGLEVPA